MSNRRSIFWLLLTLVVLVAANFILGQYGGEGVRIVKRTRLIRDGHEIDAIALTRCGVPDVRLVRDGAWRLVEPFSASVDESVVMRLVDALSTAEIQDMMSDAELLKLGRVRSDFCLDEPVATVTVSCRGKSETCSFGAHTSASNGVYAAVSGLDSVLVVPAGLLEAVSVPATDFRQRTLFPIDAESVVAFDVKRNSGAVIGFLRDGDRWRIGDAPVSARRVGELLESVVSAKAADFVWPVGATNESSRATSSLLAVYGLDPDAAVTVTLKCVDGVDRQVSFGIDADDSHVYALVQNGGAIVTVDAKLRQLAAQESLSFTDSRLFPFEDSSVNSFSIADGNVAYALARTADGAWRIDSPVSAPADQAVVGKLLERVLSLSFADVSSAGVSVSVKPGPNVFSVSRGKLFGSLRVEDLRAKEVLNVDPSLVRRLVRVSPTETNGVSSVVYNRDRHSWNVDGEGRQGRADAAGISAVLGVISPLRAVRVEKLQVSAGELSVYGLDAPNLTVAIDLDRADAVRRNLMLGRRLADGGCFATVGSSDAVFVLDGRTASLLSSQIVGTDKEP